MAEHSDDRPTDEPRRRAAAPIPTLAEEGSDAAPALLALIAGLAALVGVVWQSTGDSPSVTTEAAGTAESVEVVDEVVDEETDEPVGEVVEDTEEAAQAAAEDLTVAELDGFDAELVAAGFEGISLSADGRVVTATGEVADEAARADVISLLAGLPGVEEVVDELTVASADSDAAPEAGVELVASQASLVLRGTVPSQEIADELVARASEIYATDQIVDELVVDEGAEPPIEISISGAITDEALFQRLSAGFDGIVGVDSVDTEGFTLEESDEFEVALNSLEPIQFSSGSAVILPESAAIIEEAAALLVENPDVVIEIGGHTDSRGSVESNQSLSQARADAVLQALVAQGVTNEMFPRGFGENRLKVDPDDTLEAQQENRRIEFRILE